jgi:hypothetical protein
MSECKTPEGHSADEIVRDHASNDMERMLAALLALVLIAVAAFSAIGVQPATTPASANERSMQG